MQFEIQIDAVGANLHIIDSSTLAVTVSREMQGSNPGGSGGEFLGTGAKAAGRRVRGTREEHAPLTPILSILGGGGGGSEIAGLPRLKSRSAMGGPQVTAADAAGGGAGGGGSTAAAPGLFSGLPAGLMQRSGSVSSMLGLMGGTGLGGAADDGGAGAGARPNNNASSVGILRRLALVMDASVAYSVRSSRQTAQVGCCLPMQRACRS
jgi:hypothetical protein